MASYSSRHASQLAPLRVIEIRRVTFLQISQVDVVSQQFSAHIYIECAIIDGALDPALAESDNQMTKFPNGEWPVVPSALWYLENQFNFSNALDHEVREVKVIKGPRDLVMIKRVYGTFSSVMDLHDFPFDAQRVPISIEVLCAANGPFPIQLVKSPAIG
tara:strand:- start:40 stop:519 length:480 start_codon:yes stop_codon:yes gene_type:complete